MRGPGATAAATRDGTTACGRRAATRSSALPARAAAALRVSACSNRFRRSSLTTPPFAKHVTRAREPAFRGADFDAHRIGYFLVRVPLDVVQHQNLAMVGAESVEDLKHVQRPGRGRYRRRHPRFGVLGDDVPPATLAIAVQGDAGQPRTECRIAAESR